MLAYHLSPQEKQALLSLVGYLAASDREVSGPERQFVLELAHDLNVPFDGVFDGIEDPDLEVLCGRFERDSAKRVALVELVDLGLADGEYFAEEKAAVREVAAAMGVGEDDVDAIEKWVHRGQKWHAEGHDLLGLSGTQKIDI